MLCYENKDAQERRFQEIIYKKPHSCNNMLYKLDENKLNFYKLSHEFGFITELGLFYHKDCNKQLNQIIEQVNEMHIKNILILSKKLNMCHQLKINCIEDRLLQNIGFKISYPKILCYKCKTRGKQHHHNHACSDDLVQNYQHNLPISLQNQIISLSQNNSFNVINCGTIFNKVFNFVLNASFVDSCLICKCEKYKYCYCYSKHLNIIRKNKFDNHKKMNRHGSVQFFKQNVPLTEFKIATFYYSNNDTNFYIKEIRKLKNFTYYFFFTEITRFNSQSCHHLYNIVDDKLM